MHVYDKICKIKESIFCTKSFETNFTLARSKKLYFHVYNEIINSRMNPKSEIQNIIVF